MLPAVLPRRVRVYRVPDGDLGGRSTPLQRARYGHVELIRETVRTQQGDPGAGAVAGAIIGGLLFGGHSPVQTMVGVAGGAMVGAAASSGGAEDRFYEIFVRFDDGALERYVYQNVLPFRVNDPVVLTAQGSTGGSGAAPREPAASSLAGPCSVARARGPSRTPP